ncbi:MAG: NADH-quinone oxidoreductase subunit D [Planctomycetes bacterium]|nr:NADH-quinone oxidoreductase subunit D [Planctomycetota bacterium]
MTAPAKPQIEPAKPQTAPARTLVLPGDPRPPDVHVDVRTQELQINMGPQHPSTHGVLRVAIWVDGEIVTRAEPDIGYLHRCAEKIGESVSCIQYVPYTDRYDYLAAMNNNLGYCLAVEKVAEIDVPEKAQYVRTVAVELNRIGSHLMAVGTYGLDLGAFTPFFYAFREREEILRLLEWICGARLTYNFIRIGGVMRDLPEGFAADTRKFLDLFETRLDEFNDLLTHNHIFVNRTANVGVISPDMAIAYGLTGPNLRGSGLRYDLRREQPYLLYDRFQFDIPVGTGIKGTVGDCWDRYWVRMLEMKESVRIVRQALDQMPATGEIMAKNVRHLAFKSKPGEGYLGIENPRGELGYYLISDGGANSYRSRIRAPSFCNLSILEAILPGTMLADAVAIIGSIDIVLGEVDR